MTTCEKHGCALTPLFTSAFCARCDEEAAVNAAQVPEVVAVGSGSMVGQDGKVIRYRVVGAQSPGSPDVGWYHNYPVCGTDANGSDVDDMDVCMGFTARLENVVMWLELGFVDAESAASMLGAAHEFASTLESIVERRKAIRRAQETPQPDVCLMCLRRHA